MSEDPHVESSEADPEKSDSIEDPWHDERSDIAYLIDNTPVILLRIDREGRVRHAMGAGLRALGFEPHELIGVRAVDFEPLAPTQRLLARARLGRPFDATTVVQSRHLQAHVRPLRDAKGEYDGVSLLAVDVSGQLEAEDALRQSRDELRGILASVDEGITAQRPDGSLAFANEAAAVSVGVDSVAALLRMSPQDLWEQWEILDANGEPVPPERMPNHIALTEERVALSLLRVRHRNARVERWNMLRSTPIFDATGAVKFAINFWWDVTAAQRTQQLLRAEVETLRMLSAPRALEDLGPLLEAISKAVRWDAAVMWQATEDGALMPVASRFPPDSVVPPELDAIAAQVNSANEAVWRTTADGQLSAGTFRSLCAVPLSSRGQSRGVLALLTRHDFARQPEFEHGIRHLGRIICGVVEGQRTELKLKEELTARRVAEEASIRATLLADVSRAITTSFHDQSMLLEVARLLTVRLADWVVVDVYDAGATVQRLAVVHRQGLFASDAEELKSIPPRRDLRTPLNEALRSARPQLVSAIARTTELVPMAWQSPSGSVEGHARALTERLGAASFVAVPLVGRQGVLGVITCVRSRASEAYAATDLEFLEDIGRQTAVGMESARLLDSTQQALRARDEFLSIASHELRTPVTSLQLALQALERSVNASGSYDSFESMLVTTARRQLSRLAKLLADLLDVTRIRAGRLVLEPRPFDLAALVKDVAGQLQSDYQKAGCDLQIDLAGVVWGNWDPARIEQVVVNLLSNAAKYGGAKPVALSLRRVEGAAVLTVRDNGIGIDFAAQASVFDPFVRAVSTRHYGGLGLGLFIVRRIVEAHGGRIRLDSEPGRGSTFTVELPGASAGPQRATEGEI